MNGEDDFDYFEEEVFDEEESADGFRFFEIDEPDPDWDDVPEYDPMLHDDMPSTRIH